MFGASFFNLLDFEGFCSGFVCERNIGQELLAAFINHKVQQA
jgi:hypothetical protein